MKQRIEDKYRSGIYVILNNVNSKKYVGKAKDENPTCKKQSIKSCCSGYKNSYKGYYWRYCYLDRDEIIEW